MEKQNPLGLTDKEIEEVLNVVKDIRSSNGEFEMTLMQFIYLGMTILKTAFSIGIKHGTTRKESTYILNEVTGDIRFYIYKLTEGTNE